MRAVSAVLAFKSLITFALGSHLSDIGLVARNTDFCNDILKPLNISTATPISVNCFYRYMDTTPLNYLAYNIHISLISPSIESDPASQIAYSDTLQSAIMSRCSLTEDSLHYKRYTPKWNSGGWGLIATPQMGQTDTSTGWNHGWVPWQPGEDFRACVGKAIGDATCGLPLDITTGGCWKLGYDGYQDEL